jgi:hypothetical protein
LVASRARESVPSRNASNKRRKPDWAPTSHTVVGVLAALLCQLGAITKGP